jgi:hypothetical protein
MEPMRRSARLDVGQKAGVDYLQVIVLGKIDDEMISKRFKFAQLLIHDDRLYPGQYGGTDIGGIAQVRIGSAGAFGTEAGHDAAQAFSPVAGTKLSAIAGDALYEELASDNRGFFEFGHVCGLPSQQLLAVAGCAAGRRANSRLV